jgi:hypothetical protein
MSLQNPSHPGLAPGEIVYDITSTDAMFEYIIVPDSQKRLLLGAVDREGMLVSGWFTIVIDAKAAEEKGLRPLKNWPDKMPFNVKTRTKTELPPELDAAAKAAMSLGPEAPSAPTAEVPSLFGSDPETELEEMKDLVAGMFGAHGYEGGVEVESSPVPKLHRGRKPGSKNRLKISSRLAKLLAPVRKIQEPPDSEENTGAGADIPWVQLCLMSDTELIRLAKMTPDALRLMLRSVDKMPEAVITGATKWHLESPAETIFVALRQPTCLWNMSVPSRRELDVEFPPGIYMLERDFLPALTQDPLNLDGVWYRVPEYYFGLPRSELVNLEVYVP